MRWYGIDFSGDHRQWRPNARQSNVWIARLEDGDAGLQLTVLQRVQELPTTYGDHPFQRLITLLQKQDFTAAGIDAPFAIPQPFVQTFGSYTALLAKVHSIVPSGGRPFPEGKSFVQAITGQTPPLTPAKPLRRSEQECSRKVNVRSTLWTGARPGAPMTAACLSLLVSAACPIWPWQSPPQSGILVEAFPATQLATWGLCASGYNGTADTARKARTVIVEHLATRIFLPDEYESRLLDSADALDAVICGFAAIAVTRGTIAVPPMPIAHDEGWIAIHP